MARRELHPTAAFAGATLDLVTIGPGERFGRIYLSRYPDPLGFGKTKSRFSDPSRRAEKYRFGVLYVGSTLKVCFLEAILRDERNGEVGDYPIAEAELQVRHYAEIEITAPLTLVDLRGDGPVRMGIPTDTVRASSQTLSRAWSAAIYKHPEAPDGMIYPSRLNGETNLAIYDRGIPKLRAAMVAPLLGTAGLAKVLDDFRIALV
jgi:RES domain-containing protein